MSKVSIIMPVYNAERYLREAIESVLRQTYTNFELLLINDRSSDNSVAICKEYGEKDPRIVLLENDTGIHGPGPTRNIGLDHATGEYIYFMDADDWIEKDLLWDTVTLAEKTGADIIPFGFVIENDENQVKKSCSPCGDYRFEDFKRVANDIIRGTWAECHELIRSEVIQNVRHNHYKTGEDICFQMDLLCHVRTACGIDKEYYHYRVVKGSISHTGSWDHMFAEISIGIWNKEKAFLEYCGLSEDSQIMKNSAIERYTGCIYSLCQRDCSLSFTEKCRQIKYIGDAMDIRIFKNNFDCSKYSGLKKIAKLLVKYGFEMIMIIMGTFYFGKM